jgi:hypothetical protein
MLLELITGRKPIMESSDHQPETLVSWVSCHEALNYGLNVCRILSLLQQSVIQMVAPLQTRFRELVQVVRVSGNDSH